MYLLSFLVLVTRILSIYCFNPAQANVTNGSLSLGDDNGGGRRSASLSSFTALEATHLKDVLTSPSRPTLLIPLVRHGLSFTGSCEFGQPLPDHHSGIVALTDLTENVLKNLNANQEVSIGSYVTSESGPFNEVSTRLDWRNDGRVPLTYAITELAIRDLLSLLHNEWATGTEYATTFMIWDGDVRIMTVQYGVLAGERVDLPTSGTLFLEGYVYNSRSLPYDDAMSCLDAHIDAIEMEIRAYGDSEVSDPEDEHVTEEQISLEYFLSSMGDGVWPRFYQRDVRVALLAIKSFFIQRGRASLATFDANIKYEDDDISCGFFLFVDRRSQLASSFAASTNGSTPGINQLWTNSSVNGSQNSPMRATRLAIEVA